MSRPVSKEVMSTRDLIKAEYKKCLVDPMYFMKKYLYIQHQVRGKIPFELYPFQEKTLEDLCKHDFNIILKSRQMGISTLVAAYSLWVLLFNSDKNILVISKTQVIAKEIIGKVSFAHKNLPSWLRVEAIENNKLSIKLKNNSRIIAASSDSDASRSFSINFLIIDECLTKFNTIYIRNKKTGEIKPVNIGELYEQNVYM